MVTSIANITPFQLLPVSISFAVHHQATVATHATSTAGVAARTQDIRFVGAIDAIRDEGTKTADPFC